MIFRTLRSTCALLAAVWLLVLGAANHAAADSLSLQWDPAAEQVGYKVHVGLQSGTYTQHFDVGSVTLFTFSGATPGQRYCFTVSAYLLSSMVEGPNSSEVCGYSNQPPTLVNPGARSSSMSQSTTLQLQGSDPDGLPVSYSATGLPLGLTLQSSTGFISGTPTTAGSFSVTASVSDGVLTASQTFTWTIAASDTTVPVVTITGPTSATTHTTTSATMTLSGTASDNVGVTQVTWVNGRGGNGTASGTTSWSAVGITLQVGSNAIAVTARDAAGNTATDVLTVTYNAPTTDITPPSVAITAPASASSVSGTVSVSATASDASGVAGVQFRLDGANIGSEDMTAPYSASWDTTIVSSGSHTLTAVARDAAGNTATSAAVVVTVGNAPPLVGGGDISSGLVSHWRFDEGSGLTTLDSAGTHPGTLRNGPLWANGRLARAVQLDGADDVVDLGSLDVSGSALTIAAWIRPDGFPVDDGRILSKTTGSAEQDHYFMLSTVGSGGYKLRFRLKTGSVTSTLVASTGALAIGEWAHAAAVYNGSAMILYLNGVEVGRLAKTGALDTNGIIPVAIGRNPQAYGAFMGALDDVRLYARALSVADLQMLVAGDTIAPTVAIAGPTSAATYLTNSATVTLNGTASDAVGVAQVSWSNDRGGSGTATGTTNWSVSGVALQTGANVIVVTAVDAAGNSATATLTVTRSTVDTTLPTVSFVTPTSGATYTTTGSTISLGGAASDNVGVTQVRWTNDRGGSGVAAGTTSWSVSGVALLSGTNVIAVTAVDAAGNAATARLTVTRSTADTTLPTVSVVTPTTGTTFSTSFSTINLTGNASDNVGVTQVKWANDTGGNGVANGTTSWAIASIGLMPGTNVITVTALDAAGNQGTDTLTVTYSGTTPPPPPPPPVTMTLTAERAGHRSVLLKWTGASGSTVDVYRNGVRIAITRNDGVTSDNVSKRGGTYNYKICASGSTTTCSNTATIFF